MSVWPTDYAAPFAVECSNNPAAEEASVDNRFPTLKEAQAYIEKAERQYSCIWLSEIGTYTTNMGSRREDWMYFWWSEGTQWGEIQGRRMGYPADYQNEWKEYVPYAEAEHRPIVREK